MILGKYTDFVFDSLYYEVQRELPEGQFVTEKTFPSSYGAIDDAVDYLLQCKRDRPGIVFRLIQVSQVSECREVL